MAQAEKPSARAARNSALRKSFVERFDFDAVAIDAAGDLDHLLIEHRRPHDVEIEQTRPRLVADRQGIFKTAIDDEQRRLALAFEQGVGGDCGADLDGLDEAVGNAVGERNAEQLFDAGDGGVGIARRVFAEKLMGDERSVGSAADDVRKGAAAIDPELPAGPHCLPYSSKRSRMKSDLPIFCQHGKYAHRS